MVKAIAPNAPIGAAYTTMWMMREEDLRSASIARVHRRPSSPSSAIAKPNRIATSSTCSRSPRGEGAEEGVRNDVQQEADDALLRAPGVT